MTYTNDRIADAAMLAAHLEWEKLVIEHVQPVPIPEPHTIGLSPFAAGWEAGREYEKQLPLTPR